MPADNLGVDLEIGVGPWTGPWPVDERYDPDLLAAGDRRNVVDRYRYWRLEAIVADLDTRRHAFPRSRRELAARPEHRHRRAKRERVSRRGGAHRRSAAVESPWRHGHRPLSARTASRLDRGIRGVGGGTGAPGDRHRQPSRCAAARARGACRPRACCSSARKGRGCPRRRAGHARLCVRSRSSARRGRSMPAWPAASLCTHGSASTASFSENRQAEGAPLSVCCLYRVYMGVAVSCPRCGGSVRPPDLMHSDWRCDDDGSVLPLHVAEHIGAGDRRRRRGPG